MNLQAVGNALGFGGFKGFVQRTKRVSVEIIQHQRNALRIRIVKINQISNGVGPIDFCPMFSNLDLTLSR
jgi:hypothetical protein